MDEMPRYIRNHIPESRVTVDRTLMQILDDAVKHGIDHPDHGTDCVCMDNLIREIRRQINSVLPTSATEPDWQRRGDIRNRVFYVMHAATRYL